MPGVLDAGAKYLVHHRVGAGGMGEVHLGTMVTPAGERPVAVKRLHAKQSTTDEAGQEATERMIAEARLVFQLTHANICQVLDLALNEQGTFIVMEYVNGCDLKTLIKSCRDTSQLLPTPAALHVIREVARGLDYAHRRRDPSGRALWLVHGDVTPQNILLSREGEVKLADFGIARVFGQGGMLGPGNEIAAGTPGFVAPEAREGNYDQRADIYSLGVSLYVAMTGRSPERGIDVDGLAGKHPELPSELVAILARMTASRREDRFATCGEIEDAISLLLAHHFPSFTASSLVRLVKAHTAESAPPLKEDNLTLVSLTGTATFLTPPPPFTEEPAASHPETLSAHGTMRVDPRVRRRKRVAVLTSAGLLVGLFGLMALVRQSKHEVSQTSVAQPAQPAQPSMPPPFETAVTAPSREKSATELPLPAPKAVEVAESARIKRAHPKMSPGASKESKSQPKVTEMGYLTVSSEPWGAVYVDGRRFAEMTPLYRAPLSAGAHRVSVYSPDKRAYTPAQSVMIRAGENRVIGFKP